MFDETNLICFGFARRYRQKIILNPCSPHRKLRSRGCKVGEKNLRPCKLFMAETKILGFEDRAGQCCNPQQPSKTCHKD